jgi:hypothetical protein
MAEIAFLMGFSSAKGKDEESEAPPLAEKPALVRAHVRSFRNGWCMVNRRFVRRFPLSQSRPRLAKEN